MLSITQYNINITGNIRANEYGRYTEVMITTVMSWRIPLNMN